MGDQMQFPKKVEDFIEEYSFKDEDEVYTNGSQLIPVFRIEQMLEYYFKNNAKQEYVAIVNITKQKKKLNKRLVIYLMIQKVIQIQLAKNMFHRTTNKQLTVWKERTILELGTR